MPKVSEEISIKIFAGRNGKGFAERMCEHSHLEMGQSETIVFSDGNIMVRILEKVRDKDVYIVQSIGMDPNNEFMELLFYIDAFKRASATSVTAIMPYFGYAKGDKKDEPRVSIRARVCADCLEAAGVDRILTMDLHSAQIQGFFKKPVDHLYGKDLLCDYIKSRNISNLVVVSPDAGFAKNARKFAVTLNTPVAIGDKARIAHDENAQVQEIIGDVEGKNVLITDDFTISMGTLAETARAVRARGAKDIYACVSHALLKEKSIENLDNSPIKELFITDTVDNQIAFNHPKVTVVSAAGLFSNAVSIIHTRGSISELFDKDKN